MNKVLSFILLSFLITVFTILVLNKGKNNNKDSDYMGQKFRLEFLYTQIQYKLLQLPDSVFSVKIIETGKPSQRYEANAIIFGMPGGSISLTVYKLFKFRSAEYLFIMNTQRPDYNNTNYAIYEYIILAKRMKRKNDINKYMGAVIKYNIFERKNLLLGQNPNIYTNLSYQDIKSIMPDFRGDIYRYNADSLIVNFNYIEDDYIKNQEILSNDSIKKHCPYLDIRIN